MKKFILFCMSVCVLLAIIGVCGVLTPKGGDTDIAEPSYEEKLEHIRTSGDYPECFVETAEKCPQTIDYVYNYPLLKDKIFAIDLSAEARSRSVPLFIQWDERWGYEPYGIGTCGCGPACLSRAAG